MPNVPFETYAFPVSGGPTKRTLPVRLADAANMRDFGAIGDDVFDNWDAINNALERFSVDLTVAVMSPFIPDSAVMATCTATLTGDVVTALTIGAIGDNYVPGRVYTIAFSGGDSGGGFVAATGTATANGSGIIDQASLSLTSGGSGYESAPTCKIEYPGHFTTLTFNSVPANLITGNYTSLIYTRTGEARITELCGVQANITATTVTLRARTDGSLNPQFTTAVVRDANLDVGDIVRFVKPGAGLLFFPAGSYRVSKPVNLNGSGRSFHLLGVGKASKIVGNFPDFVLKRQLSEPSAAAQGGSRRIEKLCIENEHANGGGIILGQCVGGNIQDCFISANQGIWTLNQGTLENGAPWGSFEMIVTNNELACGAHVAGSLGMAFMHDGPTLNNRIIGYERGWIHVGGQGGQVVAGNAFIGCGTGCFQGNMPSGQSFSANSHSIMGNKFVNCGTAIREACYLCAGNSIEAVAGGIAGDSQYGIRQRADLPRGAVIAGNYVRGFYDIASMWWDGSDNNRVNHLIVANRADSNSNPGATNGTWKLPAKTASGEFVENNVEVTYLLADLMDTGFAGAVDRREGDMFSIRNGGTNVFGAVVTSTGSHHVKVRSNQALEWIVVAGVASVTLTDGAGNTLTDGSNKLLTR